MPKLSEWRMDEGDHDNVPKVNHRIQSFIKRPFVRSVITVASGTAVAQALGMVFAPLIARLYGPEVFGLQGLFMTMVGLLSTVAAMSYPTAIVLPKSDVDALGLARLSIYIGLGTALVAEILILYFHHNLFSLLNAEEIASFSFLIPVGMFLSVIGAVLSQWLVRKKSFKFIARSTVFTALILNSIKSGMGVMHPTALVLIEANLIGTVTSTVITYFGWRKLSAGQGHAGKNFHIPTPLTQLANRYKDFPLLRTPQNLINAISQSLPVLLLATYFGASDAGQYTLAITVLGVPAAIIGGSVVSVFYPRINEALHKGEDARSLIIRATLGMAISGGLPFVTIILAGPYIFQLVFGEAWHTAGVYAQWLSPWIFLQYINKPAVSAIPALGIQGSLLIYEIFSTIIKILALWIGFALYQNATIAVAIFSVAGSFAYAWLILWVIIKSGEFKLQSVHPKDLHED